MGRAKITKGYNLPAKFVLHTVGPAVSGTVTQEDEKKLEACYRSCKTNWPGFLSGSSFSSWPVTAQVINVTYNMVDRMFIGHIPKIGADALTGVGVTMPVILGISAFAALISMGGAPRASIALGRKQHGEAERTLGTCTYTLPALSIILTVVMLLFGRKILLLFGADVQTIPYAVDYIQIY